METLSVVLALNTFVYYEIWFPFWLTYYLGTIEYNFQTCDAQLSLATVIVHFSLQSRACLTGSLSLGTKPYQALYSVLCYVLRVNAY